MNNKYIDTDKLIAEINAKIERCEKDEEDGYPDTTSPEATLKSVLTIIASLQQKQPEVDLEEAATAIILKKHPIMKDAFTMEMAFYEMLELVKAGYELGLNVRKEE